MSEFTDYSYEWRKEIFIIYTTIKCENEIWVLSSNIR